MALSAAHDLAPRLEATRYRLRLRSPLWTSRGTIEAREGFVVRLHEDGLVGRGEAHAEGTTLEELRTGRPVRPAARFALEQARLDIEAQKRGVPLARLLEPRAPLMISASALLSCRSPPELAREAHRAACDGFGTLKLKIGGSDDYARAAVVRDAAGPSTKLRLDANAAWDAPEALWKLRQLSALGIEMCEQPTHDLRGLARAAVPIAADEMLEVDPDGALERAQVLVLKPMLLGGLLPALALARRAIARGLGVVVTTSLEGAIGRAGAAHLAAAVLALAPQPAAGLATGKLLAEDLCDDPLAPRGGLVRIPDRAGLGLPP